MIASCLDDSASYNKLDQDDFDIGIIENEKANYKIDVCHHAGKKDRWHLLTIREKAWEAHNKHGDVRLDDQDNDGFVPVNHCSIGNMGDCDDTNPIVNPEEELQVTLSDGSTLYVYPKDNSIAIPWSPDLADVGATNPSNGLGNTKAIVSYYDGSGIDRTTYAAGICVNLSNNLCSWYLPSPFE